MSRGKLKLFATVLAVPLIVFWVAKELESGYESNWRSVLVRELGALTPEQAESLTLTRICSNPDTAVKLKACGTYSFVRLLERTSLGTAALGLFLLGAIAIAGIVSRRNRKLLLLLFRPGLYLTIPAVILLIIADGGLAIAAMYLSGIRGYILFGTGLAVFLGVTAITRASLGVFKRADIMVMGKRLSESINSGLRRFVDDLAVRIGAKTPQYILVGLDPNFFVTEADVHCLDGKVRGRVLYLSLPLSRIMTRDEFVAIIGHELAHYKGLDTQFSQKFYPIYRGTTDSVTALAAKISEGASKIALMPAFYTLLFFLESFAVAERTISRDRELAADKVGAQLAGVKSMASALLKVHAFSGLWEGILHAMREALAQGKQFLNVSSLFAEVVKENNAPAALDGLEERRLSHPTNTHPTLTDRLQALGLSVRDVADAALLTSPEFPAIDLISNYEDLEKNLTEAEHALMVKLGETEIGSSLSGTAEPTYRQNATAKECPACAMFNPSDAVRCLCGYKFQKEAGKS